MQQSIDGPAAPAPGLRRPPSAGAPWQQEQPPQRMQRGRVTLVTPPGSPGYSDAGYSDRGSYAPDSPQVRSPTMCVCVVGWFVHSPRSPLPLATGPPRPARSAATTGVGGLGRVGSAAVAARPAGSALTNCNAPVLAEVHSPGRLPQVRNRAAAPFAEDPALDAAWSASLGGGGGGGAGPREDFDYGDHDVPPWHADTAPRHGSGGGTKLGGALPGLAQVLSMPTLRVIALHGGGGGSE